MNNSDSQKNQICELIRLISKLDGRLTELEEVILWILLSEKTLGQTALVRYSIKFNFDFSTITVPIKVIGDFLKGEKEVNFIPENPEQEKELEKSLNLLSDLKNLYQEVA